ncbi:MAG: hypothetical protein DHS80DRAFT_16976, partial [Piptocephalis tieghemiana]
MANTEGPEICRVCRCEGTLEQPLFYPCRCSGSIKYVHTECLQSWLAHSRKPYCELCKHTFTFAPIYAPDMPATLPAHLFVRRVLLRLLSYAQTVGRVILVAFAWLVVLPFFAQYVWNGTFWVGYRLSLLFSGLPPLKYIRYKEAQAAAPSGEPTPVPDPMTYIQNRVWDILWSWEWESLARKCLQGQIIMCITLSLFIAGFILREWVLQTLPLIDQHAEVPQDEEEAQAPGTEEQWGMDQAIGDSEEGGDREGLGYRRRSIHLQFHPESGLASVRFGRRHRRTGHAKPPPYYPPRITSGVVTKANPEDGMAVDETDERWNLVHSSKRKSTHHILPTLSRPGIWKEDLFGSDAQPRPFGVFYANLFQDIEEFTEEQDTTIGAAPAMANQPHDQQQGGREGAEVPPERLLQPQEGEDQGMAEWIEDARVGQADEDPDQVMNEGREEVGEEAEQDMDEVDGLLQAVGLRGPIFLLFQNFFLMISVLFFVLVMFIGLPYLIGRIMFNGEPMDCILGPIRIVYNMSRPAIALISHAGVVWSRVLILQPLTILFSYFFPDGMVSRALHFLLTYTSPTLSSSSGKPQPWYTYVDVALGWKWTTIPVRNSTLRAWLRDHGDWSWEDESDTDRILALCFSYGTLALIILLFTALYSYFPPAQGTQRRQPGGAEAFVAQDQGFLAQDMEGEEEEEDPERRLGREAEEWLRAGEEEAGEDMFFGLVGEAERGALRVAGLMLKVAIFVAIELVLFPLACGLLLSALSMPLLHGATLEGRLSFAHRAPLACLFLHWTVGTAFMFGFASMVGALRSLLRPGVLYFIRDPKDTGFSPLREILERPAVYQLRKIGLSFHMYAVVMLLGVCAIMVPGYLGQYLGLPTSLCALPLRWDPRPLPDWWMGRFPLDLLILQAIVPLAILAKPLKWIFPVLKAWLRWFASVNSLSSFFFGVPGVHLCSRALRNPGSCRTCRSLEVRWGMEVVLVPRRDGIPLPRLRPGVGEDDGVVRRRPRRGQELQEGEGTAWAETKDYQFVYVPPNLKRRIVFVILGSWVFIASLVTLLFLLPVTIGR